MRYRNYFVLLLSFLSLLFCSSCEEETMQHSKEARRVMENFIAKAQKEHGLFLTSLGGALMEDVKKIFLGFGLEKRVTLEEARELYVKVAQELLAEINADEGVRPYLRKYPFDINDIELGLSFYDGYPTRVPKEYVAYISYVKGVLFYSKKDPELGLGDLTKESFSEAVRKVEASKKGK